MIWGDVSTTRDYLHVEEVVDALILAASTTTPASIYNVGSGEGWTLNQIINHLRALIRSPICVRYEAPRPYDVPVNILNIALAARDLAWAQNTILEEGLRLTVEALMRDPNSGFSNRENVHRINEQ